MHGYRIAFLSGLAAGFVLGTRAGRERYEQIKKLVRTATANPAVQQAAGTLQAQGTGLVKTAGAKVTGGLHDKMPKMSEAVRSKAPGRRPKHGSNAFTSTSGPAEATGSYPFATAGSPPGTNGSH